MTYDLTVRQGLAWMLFNGYRGPHYELLDELVRRGALTTLCYLSPTGEAPYGGRSNQFHHMEAMIACFCEYQASCYAQKGDDLLAGAFKRQARLCAQATRPWIQDTDNWWHIKNRFDPQAEHGWQDYATVTAYGLLAANLFCVAYLMANDSIEEGATPGDVGGYVFELESDFHRIFATCQGTHLQIDTRGQAGYDATGLGRFHRRNAPTYLGLSSSFVPEPLYKLSDAVPARNIAIGPGWLGQDSKWIHLADCAKLIQSTKVEVITENSSTLEFTVTYELGDGISIREQYALTGGEVVIRATVTPTPEAICVTVPLFETDGRVQSNIEQEDGTIAVVAEEGRYVAEAPLMDLRITDERAANYNGIYRLAIAQQPGGSAQWRLVLDREP